MMMDILRPDSGSIVLLGQPVSEASKARIGYLPEERGLYKNYKLLECLVYLAVLKGLPRGEAKQRALALLKRVELSDYAGRKIKELSKGMNQKAQFLAAIVHDPDLLILDEPFQGLDPVNTELLKTILLEEQARGKTVILSTHDMNQVEAMCNRILLIDHGRVVLYGPLDEIKAGYAEHAVVVECDRLPDSLAGVRRVQPLNHGHELALEADVTPQAILRQLVDAGVVIQRFEVAIPPLEKIFISVVEGNQ
jgi:ABC-2 type transport system ATP-binding protein